MVEVLVFSERWEGFVTLWCEMILPQCASEAYLKLTAELEYGFV